MADISLQHPERFRLSGHLQPNAIGFSQHWYPRKWQRTSGCGPTNAATLMHYTIDGVRSQDAAQALMQKAWQHVTPGWLGVMRAAHFDRGYRAMSGTFGLHAERHLFSIPPLLPAPSHDDFFHFIYTRLQADQPIAFLNRHSRTAGIDNWHWVTIIAADTSGTDVTILDGGVLRHVDIGHWLATGRLGGALLSYTHVPMIKE